MAGHALPLYLSLRQHTTEAQAKETAIRRASIMYDLSGHGQDSRLQSRGRRVRPGPERRSSAPPLPVTAWLHGRRQSASGPRLAVAGGPTQPTRP